jgi:hypothetical protein
MDFKHYDIKTKTPSLIMNILNHELENISKSSHTLKNNYTIDNLKLDRMLTFDILVDMQKLKIICMSGLQRFADNLARVSSRYYFSPEYSEKWIRGNKRFRPNWEYLVPHQITVARENNITGLFWSIENCKSDKSFKLIADNSIPFLKKVNCSSKPLDGKYMLYETKQKVCQIVLDEYPDAELNLSQEIKYSYDPFFEKYKNEIDLLIDQQELNLDNDSWLSDKSIIKLINLSEIMPKHPIIEYLNEKYYDKIFKVMVAKVVGNIPEHRDGSPEAKAYNMHMKIKLNGDWSGFYTKSNIFGRMGFTQNCDNNHNVIIFDNNTYTHYVNDSKFTVIIPYGVLK